MDKIITKLQEHDKLFKQADKRFDQIDKRFDEHDKRFDEHDKRFDQIDKRFDHLDEQIDFLAKKVLNHDERLERIEDNMATKDDLREMSITLDKLVGLAVKKDQELTLIAHGMRKIEDKMEEYDMDLKLIKPILGLS